MSFRHFPSERSGRARSRVPRALAVVLFVLQALLWGGGSILEGRASAESLSRYSHVEDQSTTTCPPIHSHLDCLICRTLNGGAAGGSSPAIAVLTSANAGMPASHTEVSDECGRPGTLGSRAPPLA